MLGYRLIWKPHVNKIEQEVAVQKFQTELQEQRLLAANYGCEVWGFESIREAFAVGALPIPRLDPRNVRARAGILWEFVSGVLCPSLRVGLITREPV